MKTAINKFIVIALLSVLTQGISLGQSFSNVGSASANFLKIPVEPSGAALGNSCVASVTGIAGLYWNPAAIAYTEGTEVLLSRVNWIGDTKLSFLGAAHNLGFGTIGISLTALTMDDMEITTETEPDGTGKFFNAGSYAIGLSYGMKIIDRFSFGGTVKYIYEYIWETKGSTVVFDLGSIYQTDFYKMRIGMRLANFGGDMAFTGSPIDNKKDVIDQSGITYAYDPRKDRITSEYSLPQLFNVGISFEPFELKDQKLTLTAAVNDPKDNVTQLGFGGEYAWNNTLFLRAGYKSSYDEQNISGGIGVKVNMGMLTPQADFSYASFGKLGSVLLFSLKVGM
jgi:hypothetical protein